MLRFVAAFAALTICTQAFALELRVAPAEGIVLNRANGRGYSDLVVHAVSITTGADERATIHSLRIDIMRGDAVMETRIISAEQIVATSRGLADAGFTEAVDAQVLSAGGLDALTGRDVTLAGAAEMGPSMALVAAQHYFSVPGEPDSVRATVAFRDRRGRTRSMETSASVAAYTSPIAHTSPVSGLWVQQALPTLQSHHRLNPSTEFATDFFRMTETGEIYTGDPVDAANAPGFGQPVLATADGVVVSVVADETQDRAAMLRRPDETPQQAGQRIGQYMMTRMQRDFRRAAAGNLIVVRHERDGVVEYSSYGHLRAGSVRVSVGQNVRQGETIAEVGDTGDSAAVHLHYQVNSGADPFTTRSLPVRFTNLRSVGGNTELGRFVRGE